MRSTPARHPVDATNVFIASAFSTASSQSMSSARLMLDSTSRGMPACVHTCSSFHPSRPAAHWTTLRAAWASKLNVSSTRPAPSSGLESIATRNVLGSLRGSNALVRVRQFDRAFEHPAIQVGGDQPFAKVLQRALRKRRRLGPEAPQHHLHPQVDQRQLDHLGIGHAQVALHQHRHGHHRGRPRLFPGARGAVHRGQLLLKRVVKQLVPMQPQKAQQLPDATEPLQQELLLPRRRDGRCPTRDRHQHASWAHGPRTHQITSARSDA